MRSFVFDKIVRDKIIDLLQTNEVHFNTSSLTPQEIRQKLDEKLLEEVEEVQQAENLEETKEELADVLEVIHAYAHHLGIDMLEIENVRKKKAEVKGGFKNALFVKTVTLPDDHPHIAYYERQPTRYQEITSK